jgi:FMN phosphatase YigB (HAD superfamily)
LIIFDLDDTLIDSSGSVTPLKLRLCVEKLSALGLPLPDLDEAYRRLFAINEQLGKTVDAVRAFISAYPNPPDLSEVFQWLFAPLPEDFVVPTTPGAREILAFYQKRFLLALVTGGHPPFQMEKLEKSGIDRSCFSMIAVPEDSRKGPFYEAAQRKFGLSAKEIWVCGDRIAMDLAPAHALGFRTIHVRWGRGSRVVTESWVDHAVSDLRGLREIIQ